ncbi:MAG: TonB-dependent receptor [Ignavibacteriales bacterium]|nr:TonB-dependent receptor [Ignavibacteriales bacterium]
MGAYSQLDFNLIENLKSTAGIRYDITKIEGLSDFSSFAPKVGFNFKVNDKIFLRSSAGWGFRAPSLAEVFTSTSTSGITVKPNLNIKPESNLFIEAGVKYMPFDEWSLDGAIFNNELFDFIEPSVDPSDGLIFFNNVTRARIQGSEITSEVLLFDKKIILTFGYTYLWARDLNLNKSLKYRPRHSLISSAQYNLSNFNFGLNFRYWNRVEEIDEELKFIVQDADKRVEVFLLDLNAGFDFNRLSLPLKINFIANNLLNYNYIELIGNLQPIRNFSLSMELNF